MALATALLIAAGGPVAASPCPAALSDAAATHRVPPQLMRAIGTVESGHHPFAIQADGRSWRPPSPAAALEQISRLQEQGISSIDVGCAQINMRWHGTRITAEYALDARRNADYAAAFLADLQRRHGSWDEAAAHYHAGDPQAQQRYLGRLARAGWQAEDWRSGSARAAPTRDSRAVLRLIRAADGVGVGPEPALRRAAQLRALQNDLAAVAGHRRPSSSVCAPRWAALADPGSRC